MVNSKYLNPGPQTKLTDRVYEHADKAKNTVINNPRIATLSEPLISIHRTCKYIFQISYVNGYNSNPKSKKEEEANKRLKASLFRKRDLDQVLKEGKYPTCSDIGLLFRGLMIAQGHPTVYVETFHEDYLFDRSFHGHVFGRVFGEDEIIFVNPRPNPIIDNQEIDIFPYIIFKEGLDSWDIGIHSYEDMDRLKGDNIEILLARYEQNLKNLFDGKMDKLQILRDRFKHS